MLLLVAGVVFGVVGRFVREHTQEDFKQSLTQAPEGAGMALALLALVLIVGLAPGAGAAERVGPEMNGMAHELVAGPAHLGFLELAGLVADGGCAGNALQRLVGTVAIGVAPNGRQEPGGQDFLGPRQAAVEL